MTDKADQAFTEFVERVEPRLRVALLALFGLERGREATAEALAYAWEHWDRVAAMDKPVGYLYRVGQSKSRTRRRPPVEPVSSNPGEVWVEPQLPAALSRLSRKQRLAVVLVHGYGWTAPEAADLMKVSPATVHTHMKRGLAKLRSALKVVTNA